MNRMLSTEEFVERATQTHQGKYGYHLVNYAGNRYRVTIVCPDHGLFEQIAANHLNGGKCPECAKESRAEKNRLTTEIFIQRARKIHGDRYDYTRTVYTIAKKKVVVTCLKHGDFTVLPSNHLAGTNCPECVKGEMGQWNLLTIEEFIKRATALHGDLDDYSETVYQGWRGRVTISCIHHGSYSVEVGSYLKGSRCRKCSDEARVMGTEEFVRRARLMHGDRYDYSKSTYLGIRDLITITCYTHGPFPQLPSNHLRGSGCPHCMASSGETAIARALDKWGIRYERQRIFKGCKGDYLCLPFDFYLRIGKCQILVEFDGKHHFESIKKWGGEENLKQVQRYDAIKDVFAAANNIPLIRIPYTVKNIEAYLQAELERHLGHPLDSLPARVERDRAVAVINPYSYQQLGFGV